MQLIEMAGLFFSE